MTQTRTDSPTLFGHPAGLFTLFFAEMWERFSYYGMRALLVFYMIKGFLGFSDNNAYAIYGAYTALVYMTPYFGGMLADKLLGRRRAVVFGGLLMAAGHLLMTVENKVAFFGALALLIAGNGFFKPNISTIVGELYPKASGKKDTGFTIFYMGINLGAAMSPIVCGYVGETYGWHYGFGLATIGMLVGVAVFVAPTRLTQALIGGGALTTAIAMPFWQDTGLQLGVRLFMAVILVAAAAVAVTALGRGPLPAWAGAPPDPAALKRKVGGVLSAELVVYLGTLVAVVAFAFIVKIKVSLGGEEHELAGWVLNLTGILFLVYLIYDMVKRCTKIEAQRLTVVLVLFFFSMLFWAFFEQAGSSLNNWTDRNVDRAFEERALTTADVGSSIPFRVSVKTEDPDLAVLPFLSQEQLGYANDNAQMQASIAAAIRFEENARNADRPEPDKLTPAAIDALVAGVNKYEVLTMTGLTYLRAAAARDNAPQEMQTIGWTVSAKNVGMGIARSEIPASEYQAANPIYIIIFGLLLSALWAFLAKRGRDPSTPVKFALSLAQLGVGFLLFWYATKNADARGMSSMMYLLVGWVVITTGELCQSPVGLSMVTKLSPTRIVSTVMGGWFLATAFSNYLAGIIATFTGVAHAEGDAQVVPPPAETVAVYGDVFGIIAITALASAVLCFILAPLLSRWMHLDTLDREETPAGHG